MVDGPLLREQVISAVGTPISVSRANGEITFVFETDIDRTLLEQIVLSHSPAELDQLDQLVAKARDVWAGTDTFTMAQSQKILAGLVLVVARHLR
jgi:hypothetical protein